MSEFLDNLSNVLYKGQYQTYLVDVYGVLHDGSTAYPHARKTLQTITESATTILFSNSPKPGSGIGEKLERFGIMPGDYDHIISSGDCVQLFLKNVFSVEYSDDVAFGVTSKEERIFPTSFRNEHLPSDGEIAYVYLIGKPSRINLFSDIPNLESTDDLKKAHFVLLCDIPPIPPNSTINLASEDDIRSQYATLLKQCTIPILCVNPDVQAVVSSKIEFRPGYLADIYEKKHNGSVLYFGKPYRNIYEMATKKHNFKHEEVLCIGDNIYTDIRGATRAGLQTLLVTGGVHWSEIETLTKKGQTYENAVKSLCEEANLIPNYVVKFLM